MPHVFGSYRIVGGLGAGGMAQVYLAVSAKMPGFEKLVALKVMRSSLGAEPEFQEMFMQEAKIAARLNHPNVVQTYEVGEEGGRSYIAMEYLEGQSLSMVMRRAGAEGIPVGIGLRILADVLLGLHYAHELTTFSGTPMNVVHRDVSPQNIFVLYTGSAKVVDFGVAKIAGSAPTRAGMLKGKLAYMAPEQAISGPVDRRSDLFAVAVVLWEMIARRRLVHFAEDDVAAIGSRMMGSEPSIRVVAPPGTHETLLAICERGMHHDPAQRFQTALEFNTALEAYLKEHEEAQRGDVASYVSDRFERERAKVRSAVNAQIASPISNLIDIYTGRPIEPLPVNRAILLEKTKTDIRMGPSSARTRYFLLVGGALLLAGAIATVMWKVSRPTDVQTRPIATGERPEEIDLPAAARTLTTTTLPPSPSRHMVRPPRTLPEPRSSSQSAPQGPTPSSTRGSPQKPTRTIDVNDPYR